MRKFVNSFFNNTTSTSTSNNISSSGGSLFSPKRTITASTAQKLVNVMGCVNIKANALAIIPIKLYITDEKGKRPYKEHGLYELLRYQPNPLLTASEWKKMISQDLDLRGDHFSQVVRNGLGEVVAIYPLVNDNMSVKWGKNREKIYTYSNKRVASSQILHIIDIPDSEGLRGLSRIEQAKETFEFADNTNKHGNRVFRNSVTPSGAFTHPGKLKDENAFMRLERQLENQYQGLNKAGTPLLLEGGLTFKEINVKNTDAQWIESKKLNREDLATIFGVPVSMLNDPSNTAFGNLEQKSQDFYTMTILPIITLCEEKKRQVLLTADEKKNLSIKYTYNALLRTDIKTRTEHYKTMKEIGVYNSNEIRDLEDRNSYEGGDDYFINQAYDTVENIARGKNNE